MIRRIRKLLQDNGLAGNDGIVRLGNSGGWNLGMGTTVPTDGTTGWSPGALFIDVNASDGSHIWKNDGSKTSSDFNSFEAAGLMAITDTSSAFGTDTVDGALDDIGQHIVSAQHFVNIPLHTWREAVSFTLGSGLQAQNFVPVSLFSFRETTNFDVGNLAAHGGILASDSTPILEGINDATDGCQRLTWASSNGDQVTTSIPLPPDLDTSANLVLHFRIASGGTTDAVGFTVDSFFNEGDTKVTDTSGTNQTTSYSEVTATIAASDVPAGAQMLTVGLTPVAHTTDAMYLTGMWLEYTSLAPYDTGLLTPETTPTLGPINGGTDGCYQIQWAASGGDQIVTTVPLPPNLDTSANLVLHTRIVSGGTTDAVGFTVETFFNEGDTKVSDTSETNQTTSWAEKITTIAAADIPAGAQTITIGLTPVAHTTDTLSLSATWLEYTGTLLTS